MPQIQCPPLSSCLTSSCFTCVVVAARWDIPTGTVGFTPAGKPSKDFITCLKECANITHSSKVSTASIEEFHRAKSQEPLPKAKGVTSRTPSSLLSYQSALYCHGPSPLSGVSQFLVSLGGRKEAASSSSPSSPAPSLPPSSSSEGGCNNESGGVIEIRNMNLLVVDRDDMSSAAICSLISSVADYLLFVDMGPQTLSEHSTESLPHLSRMRSVFLPAAVASRATILGCSSEYENGGMHSYSVPFGGHLAECIGQYASPSSLPYWVPTNPSLPETVVITNFFDVLFPELLFHAAPSSLVAHTAAANMLSATTTVPSTIPSTNVLSFIASGKESYTAKSMASEATTLEAPAPFDYSSLPCEERLVGAVDPIVPTLLPVLKERYHLRCSLPFRCVLMTYFSQRRVALIYVIQGVLKRGESLMAANLHYMGVVAPESAEGKRGPKNWEKLRHDCKVTTLKKFPIAAIDDSESNDMIHMVAAPGQFVTVQLQCDAEHLSTNDELTSAAVLYPNSQSNATSDTKGKKKSERTIRPKQSPSGCFLEMLPPYSLCGKFPAPSPVTTSSPSASDQLISVPKSSIPTAIDALFPRPFAVAEWTPSVIYSSATSSNAPIQSVPHDPVKWAVDAQGMYIRGREGIARGVLVSECGRQAICDMVQYPPKPQFGAVSPKHSSDFQHILVNVAAVHNNHSYEMSLDTHVHLLDRSPRSHHHHASNPSPPERRAIIVFTSPGVGTDVGGEIAVVVRLRVVLRKLSLIMAAMDIASITIGPSLYKHCKFEDDDPSPSRPNTTPESSSQRMPRVHIQDLVEGIHLLRGTDKGSSVHAGEASLQPLSEEEVAIVHVAAGHELIYEMPMTLMEELGIIKSSEHRRVLQLHLPRRVRPSSSAKPEGVIRSPPLEVAAVVDDSIAHAASKPTNSAPAAQLLGIWHLLSISLHNLATNNNTNRDEVNGYRLLECNHADRDILLKEGLVRAAVWHSTVVQTMKPSTALYMSGRTESLIAWDVADAVLDRAAKGPSIFFEYSNVTKRFWNLKLGDGLPHKIVRKVLMPELTWEWGRGTIHEVMGWIYVLQRSALASLSRLPKHEHRQYLDIQMNFERDTKTLLHAPGCASMALMTLIQAVDEYVAKLPDKNARWLHGIGMTLPGVWNSINHLTTGGYVTQFHDVGIPECSVRLLYSWFSAAGGVRVFGVPFASCQPLFKSAALKTLNVPENPTTLGEEASPVFGVLSRFCILPRSNALYTAMSIRGVSETSRRPHRTDSRLTFSSLVSMYLLAHASHSISARRVQRSGGCAAQDHTIAILPTDVLAIIVSYLP